MQLPVSRETRLVKSFRNSWDYLDDGFWIGPAVTVMQGTHIKIWEPSGTFQCGSQPMTLGNTGNIWTFNVYITFKSLKHRDKEKEREREKEFYPTVVYIQEA